MAMKKYLPVLALSAVSLLDSTTSLSAQETPAMPMGQAQPGGGSMTTGQGMMCPMMMGPGMMGAGTMGRGMMSPTMTRIMIVLADTNGDGQLSLEEVQAVHARIFKAADADKDGRLTADEVQKFMQGQ
jgi:hypothetical protein